jgi:hypothetical protein
VILRRRLARGVGLASLAIVAIVAPRGTAPALGADDEPGRWPPVVVTTGEAIVRAAPDRAFVTLATETRDKSPKVAQQQNAQAMASVLQRLKAAGVPAEAIRTLAYDLHLEWDYVSGKQVPRGYVARNTIEVRLDGVEKVGDVIDAAVGSGATAVSGVRFDLKARDQLEREALQQAVADARARADAAARGAGNTVDRVLKVEEQRTSFVPPRPIPMAMRAEATADAAPTQIAAGEIEIRAQVTFTAALK